MDIIGSFQQQAVYRSDIISYSMDMIGEKLLIEINPSDISYLRAYLMDESELGILNASGEWEIKPHSIKTRREVINYARANGQKNIQSMAIISEYENELRHRAKRSKRAGTKGVNVMKEQQNASVPQSYQVPKSKTEKPDVNLDIVEKKSKRETDSY